MFLIINFFTQCFNFFLDFFSEIVARSDDFLHDSSVSFVLAVGDIEFSFLLVSKDSFGDESFFLGNFSFNPFFWTVEDLYQNFSIQHHIE